MQEQQGFAIQETQAMVSHRQVQRANERNFLQVGFRRKLRRVILNKVKFHRASPPNSVVKNLPAMLKMQETWVRSLGGEIPWRRAWQPIPVFLPGESHGRRQLSMHARSSLKRKRVRSSRLVIPCLDSKALKSR